MAAELLQKDEFICLTTKPTVQLSYRFLQASKSTRSKSVLLLFLNGLALPQDAWIPTVTKLNEIRFGSMPAILTYDRFGQGKTVDRDPSDEGAVDPSHGHDCISAVKDLRQLIVQVAEERMEILDADQVALVFACNSIGCALARLYTQEHPGTVAGILLLDSILANSDFVSIFPDPEAIDFNVSSLPDGITPTLLKQGRDLLKRTFHPEMGNKEGLSRKNLSTLLPQSDSPQLKGVNEQGPYITVVGHDFETFAEQGEKIGMPKALSTTFTNPYWDSYNKGLTRITGPGRSKGPLQAPVAGHLIQRDNPDFVAHQLDDILTKVIIDS